MTPYRILLRSTWGPLLIFAAVLLLGAHAQLDVRLATSGPIEVVHYGLSAETGADQERLTSSPDFVAFSAFAVGPAAVELPVHERAQTPSGPDVDERGAQTRFRPWKAPSGTDRWILTPARFMPEAPPFRLLYGVYRL